MHVNNIYNNNERHNSMFTTFTLRYPPSALLWYKWYMLKAWCHEKEYDPPAPVWCSSSRSKCSVSALPELLLNSFNPELKLLGEGEGGTLKWGGYRVYKSTVMKLLVFYLLIVVSFNNIGSGPEFILWKSTRFSRHGNFVFAPSKEKAFLPSWET